PLLTFGYNCPLPANAGLVVVRGAAKVQVIVAHRRPLLDRLGQRAVVHAAILGHGLRNLAEDEAGGERHLAQSDTLAYLRQNLPVGAAFADGGDGRVEALDAALAVRERALALRPA